MEFLAEYGYAGLFLSAFGAATILPLASEIILTMLWLNAYDHFLLLMVATSGNVLGSIVNYIIGIRGGRWIVIRLLRISEHEMSKAEEKFKKHGQIVLLLAWLPVIGDPLTVVAGILKVNPLSFLCLVTIGKFMRYLFVVMAIEVSV
ncbi:SNARE associated Golgi protein [Desulfamplus magnetovallimortis]|uniref:SNARE associated Golgi protein n=1 Tax=Desulfamplus magnetovallimortis TaxID=1246637 RepID=L0R5J6_9BACT|nr:YqaA family protein [Desulfamplus magnetovallimortis]CCO06800.1 SNARE associated Golgi protein [Desulfamplus magnetovallimortis BW-1]SLM32851.1 SNARE associated Golgi protein [Desulfamplus magnetovallimortis]